MRKAILLVLALSLLYSCAPKQEKVERYMEDGVEVLANHLDPYKIEGEPSTLNLEEELTIDTEEDEIAETGLLDMETFDVDSEGNIYLIRWKSSENYIFKFDRNGNFVTSFCRGGQGPGELEWGGTLIINENDEILAKDPGKKKFLVFNKIGELIREIRLKRYGGPVEFLAHGKYLVFWQEGGVLDEYLYHYFGIGDSEFLKRKELDKQKHLNQTPAVAKKFEVIPHRFLACVSKKNIFIGNTERGYEIRAYDLEGNLERKIKKEYKAVVVSDEFKERSLKRYDKHPRGEEFKKRTYFPQYWPPFRYLFTDEEGRLFVMTYERGESPNEYKYDIFNADGIFIGRTTLENVQVINFEGKRLRDVPMNAMVKEDRLYCLREKESGYKELVVYRMRWE